MAETAVKKSTRDRLIEAAGQLFAEKGFADTTVKDITDRASANVAAVNYYFGDKEKLYEEVILYIFNYMRQNFPADRNLEEADSPESRFCCIVRNLLYRFISPERPAWQGVLLARERITPKPTILVVAQEEISRTRKLLLASIRGIIGPQAMKEEVDLCQENVIALILHQAHIRSPHAPPLLRRGTATPDEIDRLARQIADFSIAGIRKLCGTVERNGGDDR